MARYIDADTYKNVLEKLRHREIFPKSSDVEILRNYLDEFPTADVKPVVRGEWLNTTHGLKCSVCDTLQTYGSRYFNYCPICGARMVEE